MNNNLGNVFSTLQKFQQFASQFQGNPEQKAMELMQSGRFSPEQIRSAKEKASQLESLFGGFKGF